MTRTWSLRFGHWVLEILGAVVLIQEGLPYFFAETAARFLDLTCSKYIYLVCKNDKLFFSNYCLILILHCYLQP